MIKKKKKRVQYSPNINITPLLDVLTVLLFFLIKSMSVTAVSLDTPKDIRLPASYVKASAEEAVMISISKNEILVDRDKILQLKNEHFQPSDIGKDTRTLLPLKKVLDAKYAKRMELYKDVPDLDPENIPVPKILIQADHKLPFGLMKYMLHTVSNAGYTDYQFIIIPKS